MAEQTGFIYEAFNETVQKNSAKPALIYLGKTFTYGQLQKLVDQLAAALYSQGMRQHDKAIIYLPHVPQWIMIWMAMQKIGAVPVPVTHFYGPHDLKYLANDSSAETIFCMDTNFGYVNKIISETGLKRVIVNTLVDFIPAWKKLLGRLYNKIPEGKYTLEGNTFTIGSLLKSNGSALPAITSKEDDIVEMLYTGGTTGFPKGVPISGALFLESLDEQRKASEKVIPRGTDVVLQGAPLVHVLGQTVGLGALMAGDTVILLPKMSLDAVFDHIQRYKALSFFGTPTLYRMILEHDRLDQYNLSSLKYNFCAGDALPQEVSNRWLKKFGTPLYQGYGATETCGAITLTPAGEPFPEGTAGKVISTKSVKLMHPDTLDEVPQYEPGELYVSSKHMVREYWEKPEETAGQFVQIGESLWYKVGDIVRIDKEGWLYFMDRSVDIIKHKGYRVAASKIEAVLQEHPAVVAACAVGIPDDRVGERIKAFVVVKNDVKGISAQELTKWCRERLANYEIPQYIEFRDMLPKSRVGKMLRREIRADERRKIEALATTQKNQSLSG
ncbi:MAG: AMP-binding protein [Firmicutes bacterium]|nr:AMP-binding protein [Bacillota bacterium]